MLSNKRRTILAIASFILIASCDQPNLNKPSGDQQSDLLLMDMVFNNPGEAETVSKYKNPEFVKSLGYDAMVPQWFVNCAITYDNFEMGIVPPDSEERTWIEKRALIIDEKIAECDAAGMDIYAFTDVFIAPKSVWEKHGKNMGETKSNHGGYGGASENIREPSIQSETTQAILKAQISGIFERFPSLDGLVIRFGETYLHDTPFHFGGKPVRQGEEGIKDHIVLLNLLRDEICIKRNKKLFYRTWDFGWFHTSPEIYTSITDKIEPHKNLFFSIKHTKGDFLRKFRFNPTLGIGKHKQIVEVQCQREYEGKGAHPNYIAKSLLEGFEENQEAAGVNDLNALKSNSNFKGVWTWSRGGGWKGPYISDELWIDLNMFVMSEWTQNPERSEEDLFNEFCEKINLSTGDAAIFRKMALLSSKGILRGHYSLLTHVHPTWTRDEFMDGLGEDPSGKFSKQGRGKLNATLHAILEKGITDEIIKEKKEAVSIWKEIEAMSKTLTSGDSEMRSFIEVSCTYGRIKYEIFCEAWIVMLKGLEGDRNGVYETEIMAKSIYNYHQLWKEFIMLKKNNPNCASLYKPYAFDMSYADLHGDKGLDYTINKYEKLLVSK